MTNKRTPFRQKPPRARYARGERTHTLSRAILQTLLQSGARPGDRLPTEHELAKWFQVSRPTVRQAIKALDGAGLVEARPRRGTVLRPAGPRSLAPWFGAHLALARAGPPGAKAVSLAQTHAALAEARWIMERALAPLAAERRSEEDLAALEAAERAHAEAAQQKDREAVRAADAAFHRAYMAAAHNPVLSGLAELIDGYFGTLAELEPPAVRGRKPPPASTRRTLAEHRALREALRARDAERVAAILERHLGRTLRKGRLPKKTPRRRQRGISQKT